MKFVLIPILVFFQSVAWAGPSVTFQGRILDPSGVPVEKAGVQFHVRLLTPNANLCSLYDETQTLDLTGSGGMFTISLGDGTGTTNTPTTYNLTQALSNRTSWPFAQLKLIG